MRCKECDLEAVLEFAVTIEGVDVEPDVYGLCEAHFNELQTRALTGPCPPCEVEFEVSDEVYRRLFP